MKLMSLTYIEKLYHWKIYLNINSEGWTRRRMVVKTTYLLVVVTDLRQVSNLETRLQEIQEFFLSVPMLNKFSVFKKNPFGLQIQRFDEIPP